MEPDKKITPAFFFLSIATIASLIISVSAFLNLTFEILNIRFPDALTDYFRYEMSTNDIRTSLALLLVIFPIYLLLEFLWQKTLVNQSTQKNHTLKKWAVYLILFLVAAMLIVNFVVLVRYFVSGEITIRFVYKVGAVFLTGIIVGWFYVRKLQRDVDNKRSIFAVCSGVLVLALIIWSFGVTGSPKTQRSIRMDARRISDIQSIQGQLISYWQQAQDLPQFLSVLENPISAYMIPRDPETGTPYEYIKVSPLAFSVCAVFDLPSPDTRMSARPISEPSYPSDRLIQEQWSHPAGQYCFGRTIDPNIYPPFKKTP